MLSAEAALQHFLIDFINSMQYQA